MCIRDRFEGLSLELKEVEETAGAEITSFRFNLSDGTSYEPVSYTHLDVYKRQRWSRLLLTRQVPPVSARRSFSGDWCYSDRRAAVSYTHLLSIKSIAFLYAMTQVFSCKQTVNVIYYK